MKQLTVASDFYTAGFDFRVPQVPGAPDGQAGVFVFPLGTPYEVTDETAAAVQAAYAGFPERVRNRLRLTITPIAGEVVAGAVAAPALPPASAAEAPEPILDLSDDDDELIAAELEKIQDLTIARAKPIIEKTALDENLPIGLRRAYLAAIKAGDFQKGLKDEVDELIEAIA